MARVSLYTTFKRAPLSDVHQVAVHTVGPGKSEQRAAAITSKQDWTSRRKAKPVEVLLPRTVSWIAALPVEFQPTATARSFPRIANQLATLWSMSGEMASYFIELLVDNRGGRQGFPIRVLSELHALRQYYASLHS